MPNRRTNTPIHITAAAAVSSNTTSRTPASMLADILLNCIPETVRVEAVVELGVEVVRYLPRGRGVCSKEGCHC